MSSILAIQSPNDYLNSHCTGNLQIFINMAIIMVIELSIDSNNSHIFGRDIKMFKKRAYSKYSLEAASLLGKHIKLGRKKRKWSESELADRAGISRATVQKIEKGEMSCALGLVLESAALVGVKLFDSDMQLLSQQTDRIDDKIALLPKIAQKARKSVNDDF